MLLKINEEFVRAQSDIFTLGWKKYQLYRKFGLGLAKGGDYMEICNAGLNFNSLNPVEISS